MWKMSFCDSDQKSMPIVGFLTCNGSSIFCGPKLVPIGGLDTELISRLQWLKVARKQLAGQECLIGAVETLTDALAHSGLVGGSLQGKAGVSRSVWKGKGKGRGDVGVSPEMSNEDADGEKDGSKDGGEEDD